MTTPSINYKFDACTPRHSKDKDVMIRVLSVKSEYHAADLKKAGACMMKDKNVVVFKSTTDVPKSLVELEKIRQGVRATYDPKPIPEPAIPETGKPSFWKDPIGWIKYTIEHDKPTAILIGTGVVGLVALIVMLIRRGGRGPDGYKDNNDGSVSLFKGDKELRVLRELDATVFKTVREKGSLTNEQIHTAVAQSGGTATLSEINATIKNLRKAKALAKGKKKTFILRKGLVEKKEAVAAAPASTAADPAQSGTYTKAVDVSGNITEMKARLSDGRLVHYNTGWKLEAVKKTMQPQPVDFGSVAAAAWPVATAAGYPNTNQAQFGKELQDELSPYFVGQGTLPNGAQANMYQFKLTEFVPPAPAAQAPAVQQPAVQQSAVQQPAAAAQNFDWNAESAAAPAQTPAAPLQQQAPVVQPMAQPQQAAPAFPQGGAAAVPPPRRTSAPQAALPAIKVPSIEDKPAPAPAPVAQPKPITIPQMNDALTAGVSGETWQQILNAVVANKMNDNQTMANMTRVKDGMLPYSALREMDPHLTDNHGNVVRLATHADVEAVMKGKTVMGGYGMDANEARQIANIWAIKEAKGSIFSEGKIDLAGASDMFVSIAAKNTDVAHRLNEGEGLLAEFLGRTSSWAKHGLEGMIAIPMLAHMGAHLRSSYKGNDAEAVQMREAIDEFFSWYFGHIIANDHLRAAADLNALELPIVEDCWLKIVDGVRKIAVADLQYSGGDQTSALDSLAEADDRFAGVDIPAEYQEQLAAIQSYARKLSGKFLGDPSGVGGGSSGGGIPVENHSGVSGGVASDLGSLEASARIAGGISLNAGAIETAGLRGAGVFIDPSISSTYKPAQPQVFAAWSKMSPSMRSARLMS